MLANQDKQIRMLIQRTEDLAEERGKLYLELLEVRAELNESTDQIQRMEIAHTRLVGWCDCARELLAPMFAAGV